MRPRRADANVLDLEGRPQRPQHGSFHRRPPSTRAVRIPGDEQRFETAEKDHRLPAWLARPERQSGEAPEEGVEGQLCLEASERSTETEMDPIGKGHVAIGLAANVERVGCLELARIA